MSGAAAAADSETAPDEAASAGVGGALLPLLILALVTADGFTAMGSFAIVQESAKAELGLSDSLLGLIQGMSAAIPLLLFSIPIGVLVDRVHRVRLMAALAGVWTLGTLLTGLAPGPGSLFVARMLTGIGTTGALTAALSLCADYCRPAERGRALLIVNIGKAVGTAAAFSLTGWLFGRFGRVALPGWFGTLAAWRTAHVALALLSALALLPLIALREPARHESEGGPHAPVAVVTRELWSRRAFLAPLFAGQVAVVMADAAAAIWIAPVLQRGYHLRPQDFSGWVGAIIFAGGLLGGVLGGFAADAGHKSGRRGGILIGAVIAAAIGIPAALFPVMPTPALAGVALFALVLCGAVTALIVSAALTVLLPNELRGLCIGAFIAIAGLIGYGLAPSLVTVVSGAMGGEAQLGPALALVGVGVSIVSFLAFLLAVRRAPVR